MNYPHLATRLFNVPLMARYDFAQAYATTFDRLIGGKLPRIEARVTDSGIDVPARAGYDVTSDGIGVLTIEGPLVQRAGQITPDCSPIVSYQWVNAQLLAMAGDPKVRAMLLEFDSPGGEVSNVFELGAQIRAMPGKSGKPVWAIANEGAFSAAYALAAGAERIMLPATAMAGSVGVIMLHLDVSRAAEKKGYVFTPIFAGARKNDFSPTEPLSKEALAIGQARVDELMGIFSQYVAAARRIEQKAVLATDAGIFNATDAVRLGLADGIATFDETLGMLRDSMRSKSAVFSPRQAGAPTPKGTKMDKDNTAPANSAANSTEQQQQAVPAAPAVDAVKVAADARAAERSRVNAILGSDEAKGREALAQHLAANTDLSAEAAIATLKVAPKPAAPGNPLADAMNRIPNPKVGIDGGDGGESQTKRPMTSAEVIQMRNKQAGVR